MFESVTKKLRDAKKVVFVTGQEFPKRVESPLLEEKMDCGEIMMQ